MRSHNITAKTLKEKSQALLSMRAWGLLALSFVLVASAAAVRILGFTLYGNNVLWIEGLHALLDSLLSLFILIPVLIVRSKIGERYPYGLYKLEDLVAIILALVILLSLFLDINELFSKPSVVGIPVATVEAASILLLALAAYTKRQAGRELRSPSLLADANHMFVDVMEGGAVLVGLLAYILTRIGGAYTATVAMALLGLLLAAYEAGHDSLKAILDLPKDKEELENMRRAVEGVIGETGELLDIRARWAGPVIFVEVLLRLHPLLTIEESSLVAEKVKRSIMSAVEGVRDVAVRIEPVRRRRLKVAVPVDKPEIARNISRHFGRAAYFAVAVIEDGRIIDVEYLRNPALKKELADDASAKVLRGARVAEALFKEGATDVITCGIGEIAYAILLRHRVMVWRGLCGKSVKENLDALIKGKLVLMHEPTREESWEKDGGGRPGSGLRPA